MASKSKDQLETELTEALALVQKLTTENTAYKVSLDALTTKAKEDQEFIAKQQREFSVLSVEVERLKPFEKDLAEALAEIKQVAAQAEALKAQITEASVLFPTAGFKPGAPIEPTEDELDLRRRIRAGLTPAQAREAQAAQKAHDATLAAASSNS